MPRLSRPDRLVMPALMLVLPGLRAEPRVRDPSASSVSSRVRRSRSAGRRTRPSRSTSAASLQGRVALGPRAGQPVGRLRSAV
jgi:hypothetical protein